MIVECKPLNVWEKFVAQRAYKLNNKRTKDARTKLLAEVAVEVRLDLMPEVHVVCPTGKAYGV
jgi:hypothetical protein